MSWIKRYASSSIGKKQIVALTGLGLSVFLIAHLAGNLQIFKAFGGARGFNEYAHGLTSMAFVWVARLGLLALAIAHIGLAVKLTRENRDARGPVQYAMVRSRGRPSRRSFASQTMILSGALIAVFVVLHVKMFTLGPGMEDTRYRIVYEGETAIRDLHKLVLEAFHRPAVVGWYLLCMVVLGLHLHHALSSSLETFGVDHPRWTPLILKGSKVVAWVIAGGFALIPLLVILNVGVQP